MNADDGADGRRWNANPRNSLQGTNPEDSTGRQAMGLVSFLLLTFALTWTLALGPVRRIAFDTPAFTAAVMLLMFIPGLCALFVRLAVERSGLREAGLGRGGGRYWGLAWLGVAALGWLAVALSVRLGQAEWDRGLFKLMTAMQLRTPGSALPSPTAVGAGLLLNSLTLGTALHGLVGLGQELGWRDYLLVRLLPRVGRRPALALTGAVWGLWFAPVIRQGYLYAQHPRIGVFLMVGFCVLFGVLLGWLRLASRSVLPPALAYGSFVSQTVTSRAFLRTSSDVTTGLPGLIGLAVLLAVIVGLWLLGAFKNSAVSGEDDGEERVSEQG